MENFNLLAIDPLIMKAITDLGYTAPTPIQAQTLPLLLDGPTDFIGLAATGTGKTAAFAIPLLQRIDPKLKIVQGIVLCPTRELAIQVTEQINLLGKHKRIKAITIYGGASYADQIYGLKSGANIVVGTPGRVVDHINRGTLKLGQLKTVILDEADEMISMGFKDDLEVILNSTPREESNIWLFSATMSPGVRGVADNYLEDPKQVHTNKKDVLSTTVEQIYYMTQESNKPDLVCKIVDSAEDFYGVVFCQTKVLVADLTEYLVAHGHKADSLHGDKDQKARERTMKAFRDRKVTLLVCTDVASRGIDVKDITHVINYSLPKELDNYIHRIGRTARSGKKGFAMSLVTPSHRGLVRRIEQVTKSRMTEGKVPSSRDISTKKVGIHLEKFMEQKEFKRAVDVMNDQWKEALSKMTAEEVAGRFLSLAFPDVVKVQPVANVAVTPSRPVHERPRREDDRPRNSGRGYGRSSYSNDRSGGRPERRSEGARAESKVARSPRK